MSIPSEQSQSTPPPPESYLLAPESWTRPLDPAMFSSLGRPLEVDIGCGKGRFLLARSAAHPGTDFLGIDRLLLRLRKIDKKLRQSGTTNTRLLRIEAAYALEHLLQPLSVNTFYVFFPDPWPKRKHRRRRLFNPDFLNMLHHLLLPNGLVHVATDNEDYFAQMYKILREDQRFKECDTFEPNDDERSDFEIMFAAKGGTIGRASFCKQDLSDETV